MRSYSFGKALAIGTQTISLQHHHYVHLFSLFHIAQSPAGDSGSRRRQPGNFFSRLNPHSKISYRDYSNCFKVLSLAPSAPCNCTGTNDTGVSGKNYLCRDPRLGPKILPQRLPLASFVSGYHRFGGDSAAAFLEKWTVNGSYIYPPQNGFQLDRTGAPILGNMTLLKGTMVDRFGSEYGELLLILLLLLLLLLSY